MQMEKGSVEPFNSQEVWKYFHFNSSFRVVCFEISSSSVQTQIKGVLWPYTVDGTFRWRGRGLPSYAKVKKLNLLIHMAASWASLKDCLTFKTLFKYLKLTSELLLCRMIWHVHLIEVKWSNGLRRWIASLTSIQRRCSRVLQSSIASSPLSRSAQVSSYIV